MLLEDFGGESGSREETLGRAVASSRREARAVEERECMEALGGEEEMWDA
jgi:hypothetical protein